VPHGSSGGSRGVAQLLRGVHSRGRGPGEHGRKGGTIGAEQVKLVTVDGILEHLVLLVNLSLVVILYEVGDRHARALDLLISVIKGLKCDGIYGAVDDVFAVVPAHHPSNALGRRGIALEPVTTQFVVPVSGKGNSDAGVLWIIK